MLKRMGFTCLILLLLVLTACTDDPKKDPTDTGGGTSFTSSAESGNETQEQTNDPSDNGSIDLPKVEF